MKMNMNTALTVAGNHCNGGAGIWNGLKRMTAHGVSAIGVLTAFTDQNTTGATANREPIPEVLKAQIEATFADICPNLGAGFALIHHAFDLQGKYAKEAV